MNFKAIFLPFTFLLFLACNTSNEETKDKKDNSKKDSMTNTDTTKVVSVAPESSLQAVLDVRKNNWKEKATDEKKKVYNEGIQDIINKKIIEQAKNIGDKAPNFKLKNALGEEIELNEALKNGPVVLLWYRGGWCPYCNITLHHYQEQLDNIKEAGGQLIAISPEAPDSTLSTKEKNELQFEVVSDLGNQVAKEFGVVFELTPEVAKAYQKGFDLHSYNSDDSNTLPLAATYVIDTDGTIQFAFLDAEYRNRAEPSDVIETLNKISK